MSQLNSFICKQGDVENHFYTIIKCSYEGVKIKAEFQEDYSKRTQGHYKPGDRGGQLFFSALMFFRKWSLNRRMKKPMEEVLYLRFPVRMDT